MAPTRRSRPSYWPAVSATPSWRTQQRASVSIANRSGSSRASEGLVTSPRHSIVEMARPLLAFDEGVELLLRARFVVDRDVVIVGIDLLDGQRADVLDAHRAGRDLV